MKKILLIILSLFSFSILPSIVDHSLEEDAPFNSEWDNGYPQSRYEFVLSAFKRFWDPILLERGGKLKILKDWSDGAVNAWAERHGNTYILEVPGGMARYSLINEEAFVLVLCHELGHLIGGSPDRKTISYEGQADYFATQKCMKKILPFISPLYTGHVTLDKKRVAEAKLICRKTNAPYCLSSLKGALSLSSYFAKILKMPIPRLSTPDLKEVSRTLTKHPKPQCRLDTFKMGFLCPTSFRPLPNYENESDGFCHKELLASFSRPKCWFAAQR